MPTRIGGTVLNRIEKETELLLEMARSGEMPAYTAAAWEGVFHTDNSGENYLSEYCSGENDVLERELNALWMGDEKLRRYIPLVLAAVEKSRGSTDSTVPHTELYNYTM